jgi:acyl-CoA thioesterase-2
VKFTAMMTLEPEGPDAFAGVSPRYPWGGVYGGQVVAQALRAASSTVEPSFTVHSLHAYYLRQGRAEEVIHFQVDRVRDGRSSATRAVVARQSGGAILSMSASFHGGHSTDVDVQLATAPEASPPEELPPGGWSTTFDRRFLPTAGARGRALAWMRLNEPLGDDPALQACALAYLSDDVPGDAVLALLHPERPPANDWESVDLSIRHHSLDHTVWFHRPPSGAEGWQLQELRCESLGASRGMVVGRIFDMAGVHLATVGQEVLVRSGPGATGPRLSAAEPR